MHIVKAVLTFFEEILEIILAFVVSVSLLYLVSEGYPRIVQILLVGSLLLHVMQIKAFTPAILRPLQSVHGWYLRRRGSSKGNT